MGRSDPGMRGPEMKVDDPQQPCLLSPSSPVWRACLHRAPARWAPGSAEGAC